MRKPGLKTKPSPLPWTLTPCSNGGALLNREQQTLQIVPMEDAEFICRACNAHDTLVKALEACVGYFSVVGLHPELRKQIGEALELASHTPSPSPS